MRQEPAPTIPPRTGIEASLKMQADAAQNVDGESL
jgi:hypothetical protein